MWGRYVWNELALFYSIILRDYPEEKITDCAQSPIFPYVRSSSTPTLTSDDLGFKCTKSSLAINLACGASAKRGEGDGEKKHFSTTLACFKRSDSEDGQSEQVKQRGGRVRGEIFSSLPLFHHFLYRSLWLRAAFHYLNVWIPGPAPSVHFKPRWPQVTLNAWTQRSYEKNGRSRKGAISVQIQKDKVFEFLVYLHYLYFCNRQRNSWPHQHTKQNLMMKWALNWV